jgi:hypothetical protein
MDSLPTSFQHNSKGNLRVDGLEHAQQKANRHHAAPALRTCLHSCHCSPCKRDKRTNDMRWKNLPEQQAELEDNVRDEEYGHEPIISLALQVQIFGHARDPRISNIVPVQEGEHI